MVLAPLEVAEAASTYDLRVRVARRRPSPARRARSGTASHGRSSRPIRRCASRSARQGFLTRDARIVERKKAGLHKARKALLSSRRSARLRGHMPRATSGPMGSGASSAPSLTPELVERVGKSRDPLGRRRTRSRRTRHPRLQGPSSSRRSRDGIVSCGRHSRSRRRPSHPGRRAPRRRASASSSRPRTTRPEYNGVKLFLRRRQSLVDQRRGGDRGVLRRVRLQGGGPTERLEDAAESATSRTSSSASAPTHRPSDRGRLARTAHSRSIAPRALDGARRGGPPRSASSPTARTSTSVAVRPT